LLCEDGTTDFSFTRKEGMDVTTRGCSHHLSQTLHLFIDQEVPLTRGGRLQQSALPYQAMHQIICHQIIASQDWLSQQNTQGFIMLGHN
jgi:hypothetical protein